MSEIRIPTFMKKLKKAVSKFEKDYTKYHELNPICKSTGGEYFPSSYEEDTWWEIFNDYVSENCQFPESWMIK